MLKTRKYYHRPSFRVRPVTCESCFSSITKYFPYGFFSVGVNPSCSLSSSKWAIATTLNDFNPERVTTISPMQISSNLSFSNLTSYAHNVVAYLVRIASTNHGGHHASIYIYLSYNSRPILAQCNNCPCVGQHGITHVEHVGSHEVVSYGSISVRVTWSTIVGILVMWYGQRQSMCRVQTVIELDRYGLLLICNYSGKYMTN